MGLGFLRSSSVSNKCENKDIDTTPNPNPYSFKILELIRGNKYDFVKIKYDHCTNFEGMKILIVEKNSINKNTIKIDPHFLEGGNIVARFAPTKEGIKLAKEMI